mgnify:CR=1 FL=1
MTIDIEQHKFVVDRATELLQVALSKDIEYIKSIIHISQEAIDSYNKKNLTIADPTKRELGLFSSKVKSVICGRYFNPLEREMIASRPVSDVYEYLCDECEKKKEYDTDYDGVEYEYYDECKFCKTCKNEYHKRREEISASYKQRDKIKAEFSEACDKTLFCDDLRSKSILLSRNITDHSKLNPLQIAIRDVIHNEIIKAFQEQNQKLITKYL